MVKKGIGIFACLLFFFLYLTPCLVQASSTADALEPIIPEKECALTISYCYGETAFEGVEVRLYKVADISADFQYTLTPSFSDSGLILNGIQSAGEWNVVRSTLEAYIVARGIETDGVLETDANGQVCFEGLQTGLYFAIVDSVVQEDLHCRFDSALVSLPNLLSDGYWQYQVSVNAKAEALPPVDSDEEIELKVLKLWKGDESFVDRPPSISVELFRDGIHVDTLVLSEENHWSYSWTVKDDGARWTVSEQNVPKGYTMMVEEREASFVLTNTRIPTDPDDPDNPPQTGDTSNILVYILLMTAGGSGLIIVGLVGKRRRA